MSSLLTGIIISGGRGAETSIETFPAEANCSIPSFPEPGNPSPDSHPTILTREILPLPLSHQKWANHRGMWRWENQDGLHLLATWAIGMDTLCQLEVSQTLLSHILGHLISQERSYHGAVVLQDDTIMLVGGKHSTTTGEIVKGKLAI